MAAPSLTLLAKAAARHRAASERRQQGSERDKKAAEPNVAKSNRCRIREQLEPCMRIVACFAHAGMLAVSCSLAWAADVRDPVNAHDQVLDKAAISSYCGAHDRLLSSRTLWLAR